MNLTGRQGLGQKTGKAGPKPRKPIPRQSAKTKQRKASADGKAGAAFMAKVAQQSCAICGARPVEVHHCISARFGQRKRSDFHTIGLCFDHHRGENGIHTNKRRWEELHGLDTDYITPPAVIGC